MPRKDSLNLNQKKSSKVKEIIDTELYPVEKIIASEIKGNTVHYEIKWQDYSPNDNSVEPEFRLCCDKKLMEFVISRLDKNYTEKLPGWLETLPNLAAHKKTSLDAIDILSAIARTTVFCGSVKFCDNDTMGSSVMYLQYIRDFKQSYILHSALVPSEKRIEKDIKQYKKELAFCLRSFPEYPFVDIMILSKSLKMLYPPPPLSNLLFEPVSEEMFEKRSENVHVFAPQSDHTGFNGARPFVKSSFFKPTPIHLDKRYFEHFSQNNDQKLFEGMTRTDRYSDRPRFKINLKLKQDMGRGWFLQVADDVREGFPLLMMTGVIRPCEVAHDFLVSHGERAAFSSFVKIPRTDKCLDRRQFHDFSKFIPHSCEPTCSVRLMDSGNDYPDVVVYSLKKLCSENGYDITLDWYKGFEKDVQSYFRKNLKKGELKSFHLFEKKIDFQQCQCLMPKCREVLYVDRSLSDPSESKMKKLQNLDPKFKFSGMVLAE